MISYCKVSIGSGAAAGCSRCAKLDSGSPRELSEIVADMGSARAAAEPADTGVAFVDFEPFAHPSLPQLIGQARSMGFDRIRISTDGRSLDQGGNAFGAFSAGVTHVELLMLAGDAVTHDCLSGRPGLFESATSGARAFVAAAGRKAILSGIVPLCSHTIEHSASAVATLAQLGAIAVELDAARLKPSAAHAALLAATLETATLNRVAAWVSGWDGDSDPIYSVPPWSIAEPLR